MPPISYRGLDPKRVGLIVVHCSATGTQDFDVNDIRAWHLKRGFLDVGYHKVIKRDGTVQDGRALDRQGAHASGFNHLSVGVCLIGGVSDEDHRVPENNFTPEQFASLRDVLDELKTRFPEAEILGHRDLPKVKKACPSFDVRGWLAGGE